LISKIEAMKQYNYIGGRELEPRSCSAGTEAMKVSRNPAVRCHVVQTTDWSKLEFLSVRQQGTSERRSLEGRSPPRKPTRVYSVLLLCFPLVICSNTSRAWFRNENSQIE
jgi:hypothetical protein